MANIYRPSALQKWETLFPLNPETKILVGSYIHTGNQFPTHIVNKLIYDNSNAKDRQALDTFVASLPEYKMLQTYLPAYLANGNHVFATKNTVDLIMNRVNTEFGMKGGDLSKPDEVVDRLRELLRKISDKRSKNQKGGALRKPRPNPKVYMWRLLFPVVDDEAKRLIDRPQIMMIRFDKLLVDHLIYSNANVRANKDRVIRYVSGLPEYHMLERIIPEFISHAGNRKLAEAKTAVDAILAKTQARF